MTASDPSPDVLAPFPSIVHFIGSIPLPTTTATLTRLATALPKSLAHIPDGEPGLRRTFSGWQKAVFLPSPYLMRPPDLVDETIPVDAHTSPPAASVPMKLAPTHYDTEALSSYAEFVRLRSAGTIPASMRFQVSIPTPISLYTRWVASEWVAQAEGPYEARQAEALARIEAEIPHKDLAIQWDAPVEFIMLEGVEGPGGAFKPWFGDRGADGKRDIFPGIVERLARLGSRVAPDVQLGYHFCYGDVGHKHFVEPRDVGEMVRVANEVLAKVGRPVNWIHMPVPKDRTDEAYLQPLKELKVKGREDFMLCMGLVHPWDIEGTKKRIEVARKMAPTRFMIATECGLGRADEEELNAVLEVCQDIMADK